MGRLPPSLRFALWLVFLSLDLTEGTLASSKGRSKVDGGSISQDYTHFGTPQNPRCEPITIPLCQDIEYNMTIFPNLLNHQKQEDAGLEVHQFFPLVKVRCSNELKFFLCTMYAPVCTVLEEPIPPCRSLCTSARNGCETLMNKFGFQWPESLQCEKFPPSGLCVGENKTGENPQRHQPPTREPPRDQRPTQMAIPGANANSAGPAVFRCFRDYEVLQDTKHDKYSMRVGNETVGLCSLPCKEMFFRDPSLRELIHIWIGIWSILCAASTLFTVLTFLIDMGRFRYPERPIIFLSFCYFLISLTYIVGFVMRDELACNPGVSVKKRLVKMDGRETIFRYNSIISGPSSHRAPTLRAAQLLPLFSTFLRWPAAFGG